MSTTWSTRLSAASRRLPLMADIVAQTERLRLRGWAAGDREEFLRHLNTPNVMRWLGGVQDEAQANAAFDRIERYQSDFGHTLWIVERRSDGALLGFCGLKRVNSPGAGAPILGNVEIGWRLREDAWGQGFAKEAASASLDLAFGRFGAPHVVALTVPGNRSSIGLMTRLGMVHRPEHDYIDDRFGPELNPTIVYWLDAADWPAAQSRAPA
jgi:RimJ/RimL family protein N-acetyltransferase